MYCVLAYSVRKAIAFKCGHSIDIDECKSPVLWVNINGKSARRNVNRAPVSKFEIEPVFQCLANYKD